MVKKVFNDQGKVYNNLKIIEKVDYRITPAGDRVTRISAECLVCNKIVEMDWNKITSGRNKSCGCTSPGRRSDITGQRVGMLVAVKTTGESKRGSILWEFICDCGGSKQLTVSQFKSAHTTSCGCQQYKGSPIDLRNKRFGRLVAIEPVGQNKAKQYIWKCLCDCGMYHNVTGTSLIRGKTSSCGCYSKQMISERNKTHGLSSSTEYGAWKNAIRRCSDSKNRAYENYGGRGIKVCDEWGWPAEVGFIKFLEDMGPCPEGMSLDRIDPNGNYCKENCRWTTNYIQGYNTRKHEDNSSGKTGVSEMKDGKWQSYINFEGKRYPLGVFSSFEEAKKAREVAEIKFYGEVKGH